MNDTYTITKQQLEEVFESLEVKKDLRDSYEKDGNEKWFQKYFSEWIGTYCTIISLGLDAVYEDWKREQYAKQEA